MDPIQHPDLLAKIVANRRIRTAIARRSHQWFFAIYLGHYAKYPSAPFQKKIFEITEDAAMKNAVIVAFRGSAKSTIVTLSYAIWAILGKQQKKFIVILGQTQRQARQYLVNLKRELESNDLLRADLGPFEEQDDEWGSYSLVIAKYGARITAASSEQSIRGLRHGQHRPDLIICDDVEDLASVKTREGRDRTYQWLTGDVLPAGDRNTKIVFIGNLLHEDSLLMRLKTDMEAKRLDGVFCRYPFMDKDGTVLWPGKFQTETDVEDLKRTIASEIAWQREYLLRIIPDTDQVVHREWIQFYDVLPPEETCRMTVIAIDPAISERDTADYTAMVVAKVYGYGKDAKIYILPNPVNERLEFPNAVAQTKALVAALGDTVQVFVEDIAFQRAFPQTLEQEGIRAEAVPIGGHDKRARLNLTTHLIQQGRILFPLHGCEALIEQLVGFGVESHDDLVDAFTLLVLRLLQDINHAAPSIQWLGCDGCDNGLHGGGWREARDWNDLFRS